MFIDETGNVESFIDNLKITMVDIRSTTKLGSRDRENVVQDGRVFKQKDYINPQRLIDRMLQEFKCERILQELKILWFNLGINGIIADTISKIIDSGIFYKQSSEKYTLEGYVKRMIEYRKHSKDIVAKKRRKSGNRVCDKNDFCRRDRKDKNNYRSGKNVNTRQIDRQNYNKNYRMSSNNPIPKTTLLIQDRSIYEKFSSEAKKSSLSTKEGHKI
ncbi:hypothetical protein H8356DRAFT_1325387 [Neocallimastix lanati (nom. inval.)]|nr:hypothetical protein H8356DRAFT_1325387 [Neocallimastix sp. JGI-2020a]